MAFVEITDRAKILELYEAGLLWDSASNRRLVQPGEVPDFLLHGREYICEWDGPMPADWSDPHCRISEAAGSMDWKFYILLEE